MGFIALFVALITTLIFADVARGAITTNKTINFQGRLSTAAGATVPDGYYNMQFKIYQDGSGSAAGNPGGSLRWTENHVNNGNPSGAVQVKNGFFSVSLGSVTPFGSSVDWDASILWLSMNIAGNNSACTTFGAAPCEADGEMLPMKQITATPYAINAGAVGGKTAESFVQLAQGVQTDASTNTSSIFINKTGSGNLIQLQSAGSDAFTINSAGSLVLGSNSNKSISIADSAADEQGRDLAISAGNGGGGAGSNGGDLVMQGGEAGGTNGNGGGVVIDAGSGTGSGTGGTIAIGSTNASSITIGSTSEAIDQDVAIGANDTAGSTSNVTIGSGANAAGGTTNIQAKNTVSISTNGQTRAVFSDTTNTVYFGNGISVATPDNYTIQGTNSSTNAVAGGSLTVQGGNATTGNTNGGNVVLAGGAGSGTGSSGLVIMTTPTFSTVTNDANCYTSGSLVASSCTIAEASVNSASAVIVGFNAAGQTASVPDPSITTAGRIMYIMAAAGSADFTLSMNGGGSGNTITMKQNTATSLIWNGNDWITTNGSSSATLQDTYNNTPQNAASTDLILNNGSGGLSIQDSATAPVNATLIDIKNSSNSSLFSVNSNSANHATDGSVTAAAEFNTNWPAAGSSSTVRIVTDGHDNNDSAQVNAGTATNNGIANKLSVSPKVNSIYRASVYVKLTEGSPFTDFKVMYSPDNSTFIDCTNYTTQTINSEWTKVTCDIATDAKDANNPYVYFVQPSSPAAARTYLVDAFSFTLSGSGSSVQIGSGTAGETTLFTLDKSASAPTNENSELLLGSMYYDTTLGKVQCYESEGWGSCGASPDSFMTLSPEYANAVMNGNDVGVMTSDICSDTLGINDGSSGQPTICSTNETYNFYNWSSPETGAQTNSIYVTHQLPATFKEFVSGTTSVMGRTDSNDATVNYQIYRNSNNGGLTPCGSAIVVSNGAQSSWQTATATGGADPSTCDFNAGDSIVIRINLTAANNANAYVSNLNFVFSNH
jgi:hypothetical protein